MLCLDAVQRSNEIVRKDLEFQNFNSPKAQKSIGDTPRDLIGIPVKVKVLIISFLLPFFLEKELWIVMCDCIL